MQSKKGLFAALTIAASLLLVYVFLPGGSGTRTAARDAGFKQEVRNALNEIALPSAGDGSDWASAAENLGSFVSYRAGVLLSDVRRDELATAETLSASGGKRISRDDLADILASLAIRRLSSLSDEEIESAVEALRGFTHPDLPDSFRRGREFVSLRANGKGRMRAAELKQQIEAIRGPAAQSKLTRSLVRNAIALEIDAVCEVITDAEPEFFGGSKCDMTPIQAFLVTYAVVTDDLLAGNRAEIADKMRKIEESASSVSGGSYPAANGFKPYGRNGYIFSTPADILLDADGLNKLIEKLHEAVE